jgi:hypothetical protein
MVMPEGTSVESTANARIRLRMLPRRGLNKRRARRLTLDGSVVVDIQLVDVIERCACRPDVGEPPASHGRGRYREADERRRTEQRAGATIGIHSAQVGYTEMRHRHLPFVALLAQVV